MSVPAFDNLPHPPRSGVKPDSCNGCALEKLGKGFTDVEVGIRYRDTRILLVGEASGESEARDSLPFRPYGQSGSLLADAMRETNISRADVAITNILRCFPGHVVVEAAGVKKAFRRYYDGELITVHADGRVLPGTPNHPALTHRGWVPLGKLVEGDYLVSGSFREGVASGDPNVNGNAPRFDEFFDTFANLLIACRIVGGDMDFHGDGSAAEIEVISTDSFLWDRIQTPLSQHIGKSIFEAAYLMGQRLVRGSSGLSGAFNLFLRQLPSANRSVSGLCELFTTLWPSLVKAQTRGFGSPSGSDSTFDECLTQGAISDFGFNSQRFKALSREVSFAKITKIERSSFSGHVYNLHTDTEKYTANGFIVHNCKPVNDQLEGMWYQFNATQHCLTNYLSEVIRDLQPRVILALGGTAFRALTAPMKGRSSTLEYIRGYALPGSGVAEGIPVIGTFHPSFLRRGASHLTPLLQRDLRRAFLIATGKLIEGQHFRLDPLSHNGRYQTMPSVEEAWEWFRNIDPNRSIYADIETPRSRREDEDDRNSFADRDISLIQFTQRRGEGIALPWRDDYVDVARSILGNANRKVGHNWFGFDLPVLAANEVKVNGPQDDTMLQFHHYHPDLPQNLQAVAQFCGFPFPWKHLSDSEPELYGCLDVDATCWADETMTALLQRDGLSASYDRYVRQFWPILRDMSNRGLPISDERRLALKEVIVEEGLRADAAIKEMVPEEVLAQKQKFGYKNPPILKCEECGYEGRTDHFCSSKRDCDIDNGSEFIPEVEFTTYAELAEQSGLVLREVIVGEEEKCRCTKKNRSGCDVCAGAGIIPAGLVELRWAALTEFNPNSSHQVKRYMRYRKHPVPKHAKRTDVSGEASDTTEVKELERLFAKTRDPIYPLLIEKRQLTKIEGTYVEGWKPDRSGRIHTTFTMKPATMQLSCCAEWTLVTTNWGVMPIKRVQVGDHVWTHKKRWRRVTSTWVHRPEQMYEVHFECGHVLTCTIQHRLLCFDYGNSEEVANTGECRQGVEEVPRSRLSYSGHVGEGIGDDATQHRSNPRNLYGPSREANVEQSALLTFEDGRQESNAGEEGKGASSIHRRGVRWVRLLDVLEGRQEAICASSNDGRSVGSKDPASAMGHSSHRRGQATQPSGQLCAGDKEGPPNDSRDFGTSYGSVRITKIIPVGDLPVHDITVEEDESYESVGVFSHNSREPNVQNGLKHADPDKQPFKYRLAKAFNEMQSAEAGHLMVNFDFKSFHAQTLACEAEDADYLRLAKIDVHSFVTCHFLRNPERNNLLSMSDGDLKGFFKELKRDKQFKFVRDFKAKRAILGLGFGMGARKLYQMNLEDFASEGEAKTLMNLILESLFPKLKRYQIDIRSVAAEQKLLLNKYSVLRRFYDVQRWDRKQQKMVGGDQAEAAVAFLPASSAFGHVRDVMHRIRAREWDDRYQLVNSIHDSLVFHCHTDLVEECVDNITAEMSKPSNVLVYAKTAPFGLSVEAEASIGPDLSRMEEWKNS